MTDNKEICPLCKREIPVNHVQQGGLHIGCYETEIDVWFISLPDDCKNGYHEDNLEIIAEMLSEMDQPYLIEKKKMKAGLYHNLPEFMGF